MSAVEKARLLEWVGDNEFYMESPIYLAVASSKLREFVEKQAGEAPPSIHHPPLPNVQDLYYELLFAVARKFPDESRHETALRYIRTAESQAHEAAKGATNE